MPCWSLQIYLKVQMLVACTTVAGSTAITSQFKKNLITKLKESADYKEFPSML